MRLGAHFDRTHFSKCSTFNTWLCTADQRVIANDGGRERESVAVQQGDADLLRVLLLDYFARAQRRCAP
ncbi:MAG: hypothetical protein ACR2QM_03730 [Longimicrobiales bacterium]